MGLAWLELGLGSGLGIERDRLLVVGTDAVKPGVRFRVRFRVRVRVREG